MTEVDQLLAEAMTFQEGGLLTRMMCKLQEQEMELMELRAFKLKYEKLKALLKDEDDAQAPNSGPPS
jgi:heat shock protein HslJ